MTDKPPTRLQDARLLQQAGLPLDTPVEHRTFSEAYTEHWTAMMDAHSAFVTALHDYSDSETSPRLWHRVKRRLKQLDKAAARCVDYMARCAARLNAGQSTEQDVGELALLQTFITTRAMPFINYWVDTLDAVDNGIELTIRPGDAPRWTDDR